MQARIEQIQNEIQVLRDRIINHPVYAAIKDIDDLKIFMQYHVFAVWDFMSLLKALQNHLTCTSVPWFPKGSGNTRYLINEIVAGEESDIDLHGNRKSHYELYVDAMEQCGAETSQIKNFLQRLQSAEKLETALQLSGAPEAAGEFVSFTFEVIDSGKAHVQASAFTFGREDLIPGMFMSLVSDIDARFPGTVSLFKYYLERHIEVDGDHHSHLALEMTSELCGSDDTLWREAGESAVKALQKRIQLWDGACQAIMARKG